MLNKRFWTILPFCLCLFAQAEEAVQVEQLFQKIKPYTEVPAKFAKDFGGYPSMLAEVKNRADWEKKRLEIRKTWNDALGNWPPVIMNPKVEYLEESIGRM
ncbi:hypothetical protein EBX93_18950 [bacterium]|nr:hypothetical protein [bacterium]